MAYISELNRQRAHVFEATVTELQQDLQLGAVRERLGEVVTNEFLGMIPRLELASVNHGIVGLGQRALRDGKVALAFLSPDEAQNFNIAPSTEWLMLPEQKAYFDALSIGWFDRKILPKIGRLYSKLLIQLNPQQTLACGNQFFHAMKPTTQGQVSGSTYFVDSVSSSQHGHLIASRPSVIMRLPSSATCTTPKWFTSILLHELRHVLQSCSLPHIVPTSEEEYDNFWSQYSFRREVEAYNQHTNYLESVGIDILQAPYANTTGLERTRRELGVRVLHNDEPFDEYETFMQQLDKDYRDILFGRADIRQHVIDSCCISSLTQILLLKRFPGRTSHLDL